MEGSSLNRITYSNILLNIYLSIIFQMNQFISSLAAEPNNYKMDENMQRNAVIWKIVILAVVVIAAFTAACALVDRKFTGEFYFLGFGFKIACE